MLDSLRTEQTQTSWAMVALICQKNLQGSPLSQLDNYKF